MDQHIIGWNIPAFVIPDGGKMPSQGRPGKDVGFDAHVRAIVATEMDPAFPYRRTTLWDFTGKPHESILHQIELREVKGFLEKQLVFVLKHKQAIRVGFGVIFGMSPEWSAKLVPRSSSANAQIDVGKLHIGNVRVWHEDVPIDPDFRGEPMTLITNEGPDDVLIFHGWRPAQFQFSCCKCKQDDHFIRPNLVAVASIEELGQTERGFKSHASSGHGAHDAIERNGDDNQTLLPFPELDSRLAIAR